MNIAFVGIKKDWQKLKDENYLESFIKYHLELPWYYSEFGKNRVVVVPENDYDGPDEFFHFDNGGYVCLVSKESFSKFSSSMNVVVHWRKWFEEFYVSKAVNVINSQDHSYSSEWLSKVYNAKNEKKLDGILCFPKWHKENMLAELLSNDVEINLYSGLTLGVDTNIYKPQVKNMFDLLWASDPGRGLQKAMEMTLKLFQKDKRFKLHICYPDYASSQTQIPNHPAFVVHKNLNNGPKLWNLFNTCAFLPYTSTFKEPSSRAHRQAMAAGCVVLYPLNMGTPSCLINDGKPYTVGSDIIVDGILSDNIEIWMENIIYFANNQEKFNIISQNARQYALKENWEVQAIRFNNVMRELINEKK